MYQQFHVLSDSDPPTAYTVTSHDGGARMSCSCKSYQYSKRSPATCKHCDRLRGVVALLPDAPAPLAPRRAPVPCCDCGVLIDVDEPALNLEAGLRHLTCPRHKHTPAPSVKERQLTHLRQQHEQAMTRMVRATAADLHG